VSDAPTAMTSAARQPLGLHSRLRGLRSIVAVVEQGSVGRAADKLHLSRPAVTRALKDIEDSMGYPLFERASRGMVPTASARALALRARRAFEELATACSRAIGLISPELDTKSTATRFATIVRPQTLASLVAVASYGSGPRAGEHLGRSQPTIHRNLLDLEDLVGVALFDRTPGGTHMTRSGKVLLKGVKLAFAELTAAEDELAGLNGVLTGRVLVAALPLSSGFVLPMVLDRFLSDHPQLQVTVVDGTYAALIHQLRNAEVDLIVGALRSGLEHPDVDQETLFTDKLSVIVRSGHPCLQQSRRVALEDLLRYPWLLPLPNTPSRSALELAFEAQGLAHPMTQLEVNSPSLVRSLLLKSDRMALLSPLQLEVDLRHGQLVQLPIDMPQAQRAIGIATRKNGLLSPGACALIAALREFALTRFGADMPPQAASERMLDADNQCLRICTENGAAGPDRAGR
jgi:LysR family transcriptional regulator of gallate degradation